MSQFNLFFMTLNFLNLGVASIVEPLKNKAHLLKYIKCKAPFLLLIFLPFVAQSQNLVPNPSFEEYLECPQSTGTLNTQVLDWYSWQESPDFFHSCSSAIGSDAGVPGNAWGHQYPITGNGYVGILTFTHLVQNGREYIACALNESLEVGEQYYVFFYTSLFDGGYEIDRLCAANSIAVRFFKNPLYSPSNPLFTEAPDNFAHLNHIEFINDTANWIKIDGFIVADDAYNWLSIGNFYDDSQTQTQTLNSSGICSSIYYIENVCVAKTPQECDYLLSQSESPSSINVINIFPNPVESQFQVQSSYQFINEIKVFNAIGQLVFWSNQKENKVIIETGQWSGGLYILEVKTEDGFIKPFKVLKQ